MKTYEEYQKEVALEIERQEKEDDFTPEKVKDIRHGWVNERAQALEEQMTIKLNKHEKKMLFTILNKDFYPEKEFDVQDLQKRFEIGRTL